MLQEGSAVVAFSYFFQLVLFLKLHWQLVRQFHHFIKRRVLDEDFHGFGSRGEEVLVFVDECILEVAPDKFFPQQFNHTITLVFSFISKLFKVLSFDLDRRLETGALDNKSLWIF